MGDNINVGGATPAAPYVILSFLFEIVVECIFLVCDLFIYYASSHDYFNLCYLSSVNSD